MSNGQPADAADFGALKHLVDSRHSCRAFQSREVPEDTLLTILETAQRSASDCNIQPWNMVVVSGSALNRLREAMYQRAASGAPSISDIPPIERYFGDYLDRRRECGWSLYEALGIERGDRVASRQQALENFRFFGAPHIALITTHASLGTRAVFDCGGYLALFMLAAHALGVASVAQASIAGHVDIIRAHIALPPDHLLICGIAFGWADETHLANGFRLKRAAVNESVSFVR